MTSDNSEATGLQAAPQVEAEEVEAKGAIGVTKDIAVGAAKGAVKGAVQGAVTGGLEGALMEANKAVANAAAVKAEAPADKPAADKPVAVTVTVSADKQPPPAKV